MAASSSSTPPPTSFSKMDEKDPSLIGSHCQYTYCNVLDFLPFKCESCYGTFCLDHRSETSHKCPRAGEWAARRRKAEQEAAIKGGSGGRTLLDVDDRKVCASPQCKTITGARNPGIRCDTCRRTYCLEHRMKEDHDCKNLTPLGGRPTSAASAAVAAQREKAASALSKLRLWGKEKKAEAARALPKPKPSSAAARIVATNNLKKTAKGDEKLAPEKRLYLTVEAEAATTTSKYPKGAFFYSKDWVIGRVLDAAAKSLQIENVNNQGTDELQKLRVFHVEGGRLLEFGEKVGTALQSGNTIVLLRGVGPAAPDLIEV